jgi:hypothetical protein
MDPREELRLGNSTLPGASETPSLIGRDAIAALQQSLKGKQA